MLVPHFSRDSETSRDPKIERIVEVGNQIPDIFQSYRYLEIDWTKGIQIEPWEIGTKTRHTRIRSGVTPAESCSSSVNCWCVVVAGLITNVFASPDVPNESPKSVQPISKHEEEVRYIRTDVSHVRGQLHLIHDEGTSIVTSLDAKAQHGPIGILAEELLCSFVIDMRRQTGESDPGDFGMLF